MTNDRDQLREARRALSEMTRVCRQTAAFFEGISVLDKNRISKNLREAIRKSERFLGT